MRLRRGAPGFTLVIVTLATLCGIGLGFGLKSSTQVATKLMSHGVDSAWLRKTTSLLASHPISRASRCRRAGEPLVVTVRSEKKVKAGAMQTPLNDPSSATISSTVSSAHPVAAPAAAIRPFAVWDPGSSWTPRGSF